MARVQRGALLGVNVKGRKFEAEFTGRTDDGLVGIEPRCRNVSYRRVRPRQVEEVLDVPRRQLQLGGER